MAMDHVTTSHATPVPPRPQSRPPVTVAPAPRAERQMPSDHFQSSRTLAPAAAPQAAAPGGAEKLVGVANLGRLPHLFHLLAPVTNLFKGAGAKVTRSVQHLHHGLDAAKAAGGGFVARLGGPLSVIATGLSAVIAVMDIKHAVTVLKDPKATSHQKHLTVTQATLSGASGLTGILAAAGALGLALPFSIPVLLGISTVTGLASFAVSLFNRKSNHQGH